MLARIPPSTDEGDNETHAEVLCDAVWDALSECGLIQRFDTTRRTATRLIEFAAYDLARYDPVEAASLFTALGMFIGRVDGVQERFARKHPRLDHTPPDSIDI